MEREYASVGYGKAWHGVFEGCITKYKQYGNVNEGSWGMKRRGRGDATAQDQKVQHNKVQVQLVQGLEGIV